MWGGGLLFTICAFGIAWFFVEPAPPQTITIAAGPADGAYYQIAEEYAEYFAEHGIELVVRETAGSVENYQLLKSDPEIDIAIVQGGTAPEGIEFQANLESLASLYLEPVWVFYRNEQQINDLRDLRGMTVSLGANGSGTQAIADRLLSISGVEAETTTTFLDLGNEASSSKLKSGEIDAAILVGLPRSRTIQELLRDKNIRLMDFDRHGAWSRSLSYLSDVTLFRGVIDLQKDIPEEDTHLIAPAANLVATTDLHQAFVPLFMQAAEKSHERGNELVPEGVFPSQRLIEFPLNDLARSYFVSGPPVLQKHLPFWVASTINRGKILLIPVLTLLFPLFKIAPPVYRWRIRSRIYRWYRLLREIEADLRDGSTEESLTHHQAAIKEMHGELDEITSVPLSYMEEFYNLRLHVEYVERRVESALQSSSQIKD
jgi:TRAP transporter TAXI family solute receptor